MKCGGLVNDGDAAIYDVEGGKILGWTCGRVDQGDVWVVCGVREVSGEFVKM